MSLCIATAVEARVEKSDALACFSKLSLLRSQVLPDCLIWYLDSSSCGPGDSLGMRLSVPSSWGFADAEGDGDVGLRDDGVLNGQSAGSFPYRLYLANLTIADYTLI